VGGGLDNRCCRFADRGPHPGLIVDIIVNDLCNLAGAVGGGEGSRNTGGSLQSRITQFQWSGEGDGALD